MKSKRIMTEADEMWEQNFFENLTRAEQLQVLRELRGIRAERLEVDDAALASALHVG